MKHVKNSKPPRWKNQGTGRRKTSTPICCICWKCNSWWKKKWRRKIRSIQLPPDKVVLGMLLGVQIPKQFRCRGNCVQNFLRDFMGPHRSHHALLDKGPQFLQFLEDLGVRKNHRHFSISENVSKKTPIWRCPCNLMAIYLWMGLSIGWWRL